MNIDHILHVLHSNEVDYILIGGVNFLLHHGPELTFDVDVWIADTVDNLDRTNRALQELGAQWGPTELAWAPVPNNSQWLRRQSCFALTTDFGAVDIFREVRGLEGRYAQCKAAARYGNTATGVPYVGLSDKDMLQCQVALSPEDQKPRRIQILKEALREVG